MSELLTLQQRLSIALYDFIVRCNGNFNLFHLKLNRMIDAYEDVGLYIIKHNLELLKNNPVLSINTFIENCRIQDINNTELIKELLTFVDFLLVERVMKLVEKVNQLEDRLTQLESCKV